MDKSLLNNYFQSLFPIDSEAVEKITEKFTHFELDKGYPLINRNIVSRQTYFLEEGYMRSYILTEDNEEVTTNIFSAPCFVNDFLSFLRQQPAKEYFESITPCSFWTTDFETIQFNFHNIPDFREFSRLVFVLNYSNLNDRIIEMVSQKAETRYINLLKQKPHIFQHVPLKFIASYLGITDSTLSRIRREVGRI